MYYIKDASGNYHPAPSGYGDDNEGNPSEDLYYMDESGNFVNFVSGVGDDDANFGLDEAPVKHYKDADGNVIPIPDGYGDDGRNFGLEDIEDLTRNYDVPTVETPDPDGDTGGDDGGGGFTPPPDYEYPTRGPLITSNPPVSYPYPTMSNPNYMDSYLLDFYSNPLNQNRIDGGNTSGGLTGLPEASTFDPSIYDLHAGAEQSGASNMGEGYINPAAINETYGNHVDGYAGMPPQPDNINAITGEVINQTPVPSSYPVDGNIGVGNTDVYSSNNGSSGSTNGGGLSGVPLNVPEGMYNKFPQLPEQANQRATQAHIANYMRMMERQNGGQNGLRGLPNQASITAQDVRANGAAPTNFGPSPMANSNAGGISALTDRRPQMAMRAAGGQVFEGRVSGNGSGQDDQVMFNVDDEEIDGALLSPDEYVLAADVVAFIGDGSSDHGADKLDAFQTAVRKSATGSERQIQPFNDQMFGMLT